MPIIDIDPTLAPVERGAYRYDRGAKEIYDRTLPPGSKGKWDHTIHDYLPGTEYILTASFADGDFVIAHANYAEYLAQAYAAHRKIVLTPDILWHTVLCEIAAGVRAKPDVYASLFTTTPGEVQEITVATGAPDSLPLAALVEGIRERVPLDADLLLPAFSTTDTLAQMTRWVAFADVCSPYYRYGTYCCGYPAIDVRGTLADYNKIADLAAELALHFAIGEETDVSIYLAGKVRPLMERLIEAIERQDGAFFAKMLTTKRCGSGGEIELDGWWPTLMYAKSYGGQKPENIPSHIARATWTYLPTGEQFSINCGLFYSTEVDGFTVPQWGWVKNRIAKVENAEGAAA